MEARASNIQQRARMLLARSRKQGRLAHAYIFAGPEGAGKRTLARELAQSVLCERGTFPGCGECGACRRVEANTHPDLHWVEAEGRNIKIDSIRQLSSQLAYTSFEGGFKVGVVVEAERMTVEAQNAFLKTLEEPPPDTVLLLTTTSLNRLLPTTLSRCQILRLGPLPSDVIASLVAEKRRLGPEQAALLAALAQGNARRALDMDLELVVDFRREMIEKLLALDPAEPWAISIFADMLASVEIPPEVILDLLFSFYRDVLLLKIGLPPMTNRDLENAARQEAEKTPLPELLGRLEAIHQVRLRVAGSANPRLSFELLTMALRGAERAKVSFS